MVKKYHSKQQRYYWKHRRQVLQYQALWRQKHKDDEDFKIKARQTMKKTREIRYKYIREYKQTHPCILCGESDFRCLVFHHKNPQLKKFVISQYTNYTLSNIIKEIEKCAVLCSNCHKKLHYNESHNE